MSVEVVCLTDAGEKQRAARKILEALPEWFGIAEVREGCIRDSAGQPCFALAMGFRELEVFPTLWDERNPCQMYVMGLEGCAE